MAVYRRGYGADASQTVAAAPAEQVVVIAPEQGVGAVHHPHFRNRQRLQASRSGAAVESVTAHRAEGRVMFQSLAGDVGDGGDEQSRLDIRGEGVCIEGRIPWGDVDRLIRRWVDELPRVDMAMADGIPLDKIVIGVRVPEPLFTEAVGTVGEVLAVANRIELPLDRLDIGSEIVEVAEPLYVTMNDTCCEIAVAAHHQFLKRAVDKPSFLDYGIVELVG